MRFANANCYYHSRKSTGISKYTAEVVLAEHSSIVEVFNSRLVSEYQ